MADILSPPARVPRADALSKAAGAERYAFDDMPEGCLHAGAYRPGASMGMAHARIVAVDRQAALAVPGVLRVLTAADVPGQGRHGIVHKDQPVLCRERIRHAGDPVALVLAESPAALRAALAAMRAELAPLPGVFDPEAALKRGAPLVHPDRKDGNLLMHAVIKKGEPGRSSRPRRSACAESSSRPCRNTPFWRAQCGVARQLPDGGLEMVLSTQSPFRDRFEIGAALGLDPLSIRIRAPHMGGALRRQGRSHGAVPVGPGRALRRGQTRAHGLGREESMLAGFKRHAARLSCALGAQEDGTLTAFTCEMLYDTGAYAHLGGEVMELSMEHACGPYRVPSLRVEGRCVYTNNPIAGAFRGFGVVQASPAFEGLMDELAAKLGMDPLELRRKNALRSGDENGCGVRMGSAELPACLDALAAHPLWTGREQWRKEAPAFTRRGVGLAAVFKAWATAGACRTWPSPRWS
jgi:CO/xanthine dehydrogenase Mo-binding subunit